MQQNPHAYDNGEMTCRYSMPRDASRVPSVDRAAWLKGYDAEAARRAISKHLRKA